MTVVSVILILLLAVAITSLGAALAFTLRRLSQVESDVLSLKLALRLHLGGFPVSADLILSDPEEEYPYVHPTGPSDLPGRLRRHFPVADADHPRLRPRPRYRHRHGRAHHPPLD